MYIIKEEDQGLAKSLNSDGRYSLKINGRKKIGRIYTNAVGGRFHATEFVLDINGKIKSLGTTYNTYGPDFNKFERELIKQYEIKKID